MKITHTTKLSPLKILNMVFKFIKYTNFIAYWINFNPDNLAFSVNLINFA